MNTIIAFDFDGTLTHKDSFLKFIIFSKGTREFLKGCPYLLFVLCLFKINILSRHRAKEKIFAHFFRGMSIEHFNLKCELFSDQINAMLRKNVIAYIDKCRNKNYKLSIVSASIENWITPWALKYNIDKVIGTQVEVDKQGFISGTFSTPNCIGQEKVNRLLQCFPNRNNYKLIVFGNSNGDKELMNLADKSYFNFF